MAYLNFFSGIDLKSANLIYLNYYFICIQYQVLRISDGTTAIDTRYRFYSVVALRTILITVNQKWYLTEI